MNLFARATSFLLVALFFNLEGSKIIELKKEIPNIVLDIRYATTNNFTGKKVYPSARCFLATKAALALKNVQAALNKEGLGLKVFDAYRPFFVQEIFWKACPDARYVAKATRDATGKPVKGSKHNRGVAVDLTLIKLDTEQELEMPSQFDDFSEKAHSDYSGASPEACANRAKLKRVMAKFGFEQEPTEWWHFNFKGWKKYPLCDKSFKDFDAKKKLTKNLSKK